jgi:hypothetical protein
MTINLDTLRIYADANGSGQGARAAVQADGWLLALERAFLADSSQPDNAQLTSSNDANEGQGEGNTQNNMQNISAVLATTSEASQMPLLTSTGLEDASMNYSAPAMNMTQKLPVNTNAADTIHSESKGTLVSRQTSSVAAALRDMSASLSTVRPQTVLSQADVAHKQKFSISLGAGQKNIETVPLAAVVDHTIPEITMPLQLALKLSAQLGSAIDREEQSTASFGTNGKANELSEDGEPYEVAQMHLYQGPDGVQAWIRDAALSEQQGYSVAQNLSNELTASGLRLSMLTVNGKALNRLFQGNQYPMEEVLPFDDT